MVLALAQLHSTKSKLRLYTGPNPAHRISALSLVNHSTKATHCHHNIINILLFNMFLRDLFLAVQESDFAIRTEDNTLYDIEENFLCQ